MIKCATFIDIGKAASQTVLLLRVSGFDRTYILFPSLMNLLADHDVITIKASLMYLYSHFLKTYGLKLPSLQLLMPSFAQCNKLSVLAYGQNVHTETFQFKYMSLSKRKMSGLCRRVHNRSKPKFLRVNCLRVTFALKQDTKSYVYRYIKSTISMGLMVVSSK